MLHRLASTPETVRFGIFDAAFAPVLTIASGDSVTFACVSGGREVMPDPASGLTIPPDLAAIHAAELERIGPHILTGPVAIAGAEPGDTLEVRIEQVEPNNDWGYCAVRPLAGTLPEDFPERYVSHIAVDRAAATCKPDWGPTLPLAPFFGTMGVAPRLAMADCPAASRASMAATWTTRSWGPERRCPCPSGFLEPISRSVTVTAARATARSASTRWRWG